MSGVRGAIRRWLATEKLICIGHSHTQNVVAAARTANVALDALNFWQLPDPFVVEDGRRRLAPSLRSRLTAPVFSLIGGAVHQEVGLVVHPRPFDFVWPGDPDLPLAAAAEIIPFGAVRATMVARTQPFLDIMDMLRDAVPGAIFHMESPPPFEHETLPESDAGFYHFFGRDAVFSPIWLRFKLWRIHSEIVANHCREIGIGFIERPAESVTSEGFLRDGLNATPAHANEAYGALVLAQMRRVARRNTVAR